MPDPSEVSTRQGRCGCSPADLRALIPRRTSSAAAWRLDSTPPDSNRAIKGWPGRSRALPALPPE